MRGQHGKTAGIGVASVLFACLFACGMLSGCAGPSTRVLPREAVSDQQPYEIPEENQVLEEVNPFYLQESLDYLSSFLRVSGTPGEEQAVAYIGRLLEDYGYEMTLQRYGSGDMTGPEAVQGINVIGTRKASSPDGDILIIAASHDSLPDSPGANNNVSGVVTLLECARLLSRLSTDTELRFVSLSGSQEDHAGASYYAGSLTEVERQRVIGVIQLDTLGYVADARIALGTIDGQETLLGDLLQTAAGEVPGLTLDWNYTLRETGDHIPFIRGEMPTVVVSQVQEAYEEGSPQDRPEIVNAELLAGVVDILSHTAAGIMSADTPSQLAKSRFMNQMQDGAWVQRRAVLFPFGQSPEQVAEQMGTIGRLASSNTDGAGHPVDTYEYRMKWFDVDQIILTNYHYSDGKLETISLDADGAGVEFLEMKERIASWYGEPIGENEGPSGTEYDWNDPVYHKFIALIPAAHGFEVEIRAYQTEKTPIATCLPDGTVIRQDYTDARIAPLLNLIRNILPTEQYDQITQIVFYTDGIAETTGYLEPSEAEEAGEDMPTGTEQAVLWVDVEDAMTGDGVWRNQTETVRMLTRCYGQLLELSSDAAYVSGYRQRFLETEEDADPEATTGQAMAAPEFSEDFMRFVLFQRPEEIRDSSDGRIRFFYEFEELVLIRNWIRGNLQLSDETPTQLLPPESGAVSPEP